MLDFALSVLTGDIDLNIFLDFSKFSFAIILSYFWYRLLWKAVFSGLGVCFIREVELLYILGLKNASLLLRGERVWYELNIFWAGPEE